ncbi:enoyl-[acyl-carrier-protein] reductase (NADH) [Bradyrhizobium japonicum]
MASSANHSITSAAAIASILASPSVLPCSIVSSGAISSLRSRMIAAALRMIRQRSNGATLRQTLKPAEAAASASSRSDWPACATVPITSSVAGLRTSITLPEWAGRHLPPMKSCVFE